MVSNYNSKNSKNSKFTLERYFDDDFLSKYNFKEVSSDKISDVININVDNKNLYIKRYYKPSKRILNIILFYLRLSDSKAKREYNNLVFFNKNNINIPVIYDFFDNKHSGRACLVTESVGSVESVGNIDNTDTDTDSTSMTLYDYLVLNKPINKYQTKDNINLIKKYLDVLIKLHNNNFIHFDFRTRNALLSNNELFFIDCPNGLKYNKIWAILFSYWLQYFKLRDLALVYKDLKNILPNKFLLKLYKYYVYNTNINNSKINNRYNKLSFKDKKSIKKIINYFTSST